MKILLTGIAGFVGWKTAEFLRNDGHSIVGVDNLNDYYDVRLKEWRLNDLGVVRNDKTGEWKDTDNIVFRHLDIEDRTAIEALFDEFQFDAVINLAARAGVRYSMENPHVYMTTNANGPLNLLDAMQKRGIKKFVLASTSSLYAGQKMPFVETLPVNTPISPYAATKKGAEVMAYTYHKLYGLDVSVLRYFTVFGPAGRPDMSPLRFIKWIDEGKPIQLYGDGTQSRDFTYIDDIACGTIAALKDVGYEIINLGGGNNPITINEMIACFEKELGKKAIINYLPFHEADMMETWADIEKAKSLIGWEPEINPYGGFGKTVKWYKKNKDWMREIKL